MATWLFTLNKSLSFYLLVVSILLVRLDQTAAAYRPAGTLSPRGFANPANSNSSLIVTSRCHLIPRNTSAGRSSNGSQPTSRNSTSSLGGQPTPTGVSSPDCYQALRTLLREPAQGAPMIQMHNSTRSRSCGTCRLRVESKNSQRFLVPIETVMFGTEDKKLGGLDAVLKSCGKKGGLITIPRGPGLKHALTVDVARTSTYHQC